MKSKKTVTTHVIRGYELQVLHDGVEGISWDFPVKPNDRISSDEIQQVLSAYEWADNTDNDNLAD